MSRLRHSNVESMIHREHNVKLKKFEQNQGNNSSREHKDLPEKNWANTMQKIKLMKLTLKKAVVLTNVA